MGFLLFILAIIGIFKYPLLTIGCIFLYMGWVVLGVIFIIWSILKK
jgi:hypothetical protein